MPIPEPRHCVLVGLMGSGKSTVGTALATRLGRPFLDSDIEIQAATGQTVRELRDRIGVDSMHALEAEQLLGALASSEPAVIGAAASVVDVEACLDALREPTVVVVWLQADPAVLAERFHSDDDHRPIYGESIEGFLAQQLARRGPAFASVADIEVRVDSRSLDDVVALVAEALR